MIPLSATSGVAALAALLGLLAAMPLGAQPAPLGAPVPTWQPNGAVTALVIDGHTLYAGGSFDHVGPRTGTFAVVDVADASAITAGAAVDVTSDVVVADGAGGWFVVVGRAPYVGATETGTILHVLANGGRDPAWTAPTLGFGSAYTLVADAGRLFVGGTFGSVNGETRLGLAALDTTTGAVLPWNAQVGGDGRGFWVFALAMTANRLYVAGTFSSVAGVPRNRMAVVDTATAALLGGTLPPTLVDPTIRSIAVGPSRVYLEGGCHDSGAVVCGYDLDLNPLAGWTFPASAGPIAASASAVYATMNAASPSLRLRIAKLDPETGAAVAWLAPELGGGTPPTNAAEPVMQLHGNTLYLGGDFTAVSGEPRARVAAIDATSGALLPWAPLVSARVRSLAATAEGVGIGGDFASVGGVRRQNLVAIDLRSGQPLADTPAIDMFQVNALLKLGDVMVVAGRRRFFTQSPDVVAFSTTTGIPLAWSMSSDSQVHALAADSRRLYIGGWFSALAGQQRLNLASVDLSTAGLTSWNPSPDGLVTTLAVSGSAIYAAGQFNALPGFGRPGAAAFDTATGEVLSFNPDLAAPGLVRGFAFHGNRVLLAGEPDGTNRGALRWVERGSGATVPLASPTPAGFTAESSAQVGNTVYAVTGSTVGPGLVAVDAASGQTALWNNPMGNGGGTVAASTDYVAIGGGFFFNVGVGPPSATLTVFQAPRAGAPQRMTAAVNDATVTLGWQPGGAPAPSAYLVEAGTTPGGIEVGVFNVGPTTRVSGTLPPGTYFTRVRGSDANRSGTASSEVSVTVPATSSPPNAPGTLSASVAAGVVTLRWAAASGNAASYVVEAGTATGLSNVGAFTTGHLDTTFTTPAPAGTYFVRIRAANAFGQSVPSNEITVVVP